MQQALSGQTKEERQPEMMKRKDNFKGENLCMKQN